MKIALLKADYSDARHAADLAFLLNAYAEDPMGGGESLPEAVRRNLAGALADLPHAFSILCYADEAPVGLVNCFMGFSTFKCRPLVNIHDIAVLPVYRGRGLGRLLLAEVEREARARGCCKLTLEVLEGNRAACRAYERFGFGAYRLDPAMGRALFWQKELEPQASA